MKIEMWITITDEKGRIEKHVRANSPVLNMIDLMQIQMSQVTLSVTDTTGTNSNAGASSSNFKAIGGAGDANLGIVVGTGTGAVVIGDTALGTKIAHGSSPTQLSYGATSVGLPQTSGTSRQFTISRTFTGNPTTAVNVTEVGIYVNGGGTTRQFCIDRTLNSFTVGAGASKTVTYTIKVTV